MRGVLQRGSGWKVQALLSGIGRSRRLPSGTRSRKLRGPHLLIYLQICILQPQLVISIAIQVRTKEDALIKEGNERHLCETRY